MQNSVNKEQLFCEYYQQWIEVYKRAQSEKQQWQSI